MRVDIVSITTLVPNIRGDAFTLSFLCTSDAGINLLVTGTPLLSLGVPAGIFGATVTNVPTSATNRHKCEN